MKLEAKLADIRSQKEYRYAVEVDGLDEYNKLKDLRKRLAEETDETVKDNLEKQIKISEDILQKKGVVVGVATEEKKFLYRRLSLPPDLELLNLP